VVNACAALSAVQRSVDPAPAVAQRLGECREILVPVDVELDHLNRLGQPLRGSLSHPLDAAEAGQQDLGPLLLRLLGGVEGDRVPGDDAGDQQALTRQNHWSR
jgi:hypothetical protein